MLPVEYQQRFPNLQRRLIPGADHAASLSRSDEFHAALGELLQQTRSQQAV